MMTLIIAPAVAIAMRTCINLCIDPSPPFHRAQG
jgi:hypothetical protein